MTTVVEPKSLDELNTLIAGAGEKLVVVDFYATWCGPCRMMGPKFAKIASEIDDVIFAKIDIDGQKEAASQYKIEVMPTFIFIKNSQQVSVVCGKNEDELRTKIQLYK